MGDATWLFQARSSQAYLYSYLALVCLVQSSNRAPLSLVNLLEVSRSRSEPESSVAGKMRSWRQLRDCLFACLPTFFPTFQDCHPPELQMMTHARTTVTTQRGSIPALEQALLRLSVSAFCPCVCTHSCTCVMGTMLLKEAEKQSVAKKEKEKRKRERARDCHIG